VTEQQLDGAEIGTGLQQVNGKGVTQGVRRHRFADAALQPYLPTGAIDGGWSDWLPGAVTGKQPLSGMGALPIVPEHGQQFGWQHDIAIFVALALVNPNDHALAIDRSGPEAHGFGDSQPGRITDGQKHSVLKIIHCTQEARDFVLAQNYGKLFRLTAGGEYRSQQPMAA
jgi:hypothetical protein